jgi:hypothetical protein
MLSVSSPLGADQYRIASLLADKQPHFIGRIAGVELKVAYAVLERSSLLTDRDLLELENNAGIHTTSQESLKEYATRLVHAYEGCSMIAEWPQEGEVFLVTGEGQRFIARRTPSIPKCSALSLEPYYLPPGEFSWMSALKGKRVLVLHPFVHTFQRQIQHLLALYPNRSWFEGCMFHFLRPPVTLAGNHGHLDWKEHEEKCFQQIREHQQDHPFDVALVGAGGYGMLLSHRIHQEFQTHVVYIGGALQLFFGVIGKRWFSNKEVMTLMNDQWVRPVKEDQPTDFKRVEKGCYW